MAHDLGDVLVRYGEVLPDAWPWIVGGAVLAGLAWLAERRVPDSHRTGLRRWLPWTLALGALCLGALDVWAQRALVDDAFVSFRYADRWNEGLGLTYNDGERVEGYTNFLWTVLVGLGTRLGPRMEHVAIVGCVASYVANVFVVAAICRRLFTDSLVPMAAVLVAVQLTMTAYATTGLETAFASLMVDLGLLAWVSGHRPRLRFLAGLFWILATLTRPDHALFYAFGACVAAWLDVLPALRSGLRGDGEWRPGLQRALAYASPFTLWAAVAAWRVSFYGSLVPNTYYAKSADLWYLEQGVVYLGTWLTGSHAWALLLLLMVGLLSRGGSEAWRAARPWLALSVPAYLLYVAKVGGDFMLGRFFVSLTPLVLLGAERGARALGARRVGLGLVGALLLGGTVRGVSLLGHGEQAFWIADENTVYELVGWDPIVVDHLSFQEGQFFGTHLAERGHEVLLASPGIGMVGFYGRQPLVDTHGLTDAKVAARPVTKRSKPGHEKLAARRYLENRGVRFVRKPYYKGKFKNLSRVTLSGGTVKKQRWYVLQWDSKFMDQLAEDVPEIKVKDPRTWIDRYIKKLDKLDPRDAAADLEVLDRYYFELNEDEERRAPIAARAAEVVEEEAAEVEGEEG